MKFDISTFLVSIHTSIIVLCIFSIIYLGSVNWKKHKWILLAYLGYGWALFHLLIGPDGYGLIPTSSLLQNPASFLLFFPGLYLYTFDLIGIKRTSSWIILIHFIPFLIFQVLFSVIGFPGRAEIFNNDFKLSFLIPVVGGMFTIGAIYCYLILQLVKLNQKKYKDEYAEVNPFITLNWIKWMVLIMLGFFITGTIFPFLLPVFTNFPAIGFTLIAILFTTATLSYFSFRQPTLYQEALFLEKINNLLLKEEVAENYSLNVLGSNPTSKKNTLLSETEKEKLIIQIEQYMLEYEPFLNPKIRMPELAKTLKIPRYLFSYLINEHYQLNFFHFINQYRIEYAKKLLAEKENQYYTLESISQMAGFNSKSTFNTRFKEIVGKSPKEYQQWYLKKTTDNESEHNQS